MKAIVIVDLQRAFPVPAPLVARIEARSRAFPLRVFTQFLNLKDSLFRRKLDRHSCPPGARESQLLLAPQPGDIVFKKPSYGLNAAQIQELKQRHVTKALVCGVDSDACVLGVVFSLFDSGIDCEVDPSLCWSSSGLHQAAMQIIREQFGTADEEAELAGVQAPGGEVGTS